jgi:hypothetical protein
MADEEALTQDTYTKAEVQALITGRLKAKSEALDVTRSQLTAAQTQITEFNTTKLAPLEQKYQELSAWRAEREETDVLRGVGIADDSKAAALRRYYRGAQSDVPVAERKTLADWIAANATDPVVSALRGTTEAPAAAGAGAAGAAGAGAAGAGAGAAGAGAGAGAGAAGARNPNPPPAGNPPPQPAGKLAPEQVKAELIKLRMAGKSAEADALRMEYFGM